jgi:branched-chain amino acid transport system substrate-binding protein
MKKKALIVSLALVMVFMCTNSFAETGITENSIKIGLVGPFTGKLADWGMQRYGAIMYFDDINAEGGVFGRKIEWVQLDSACDSAKMLGAVKKGINRDKVFALFGGVCSSVIVAAKPTVVEAKIPWVIPSSSADSIIYPYNRYLFRAAASSTGQAASIAQFVQDNGYKRPAAIYSRDAYGEQILAGINKALTRRGMNLVISEGFQINDTDFVSQLMKIKEENPDVLLVIGYLREQGIILRQTHELGIKADRLATASATAAIKDIVPKDALVGTYIVTSLQGPSESPKYEWFKRKLRKEHPKVANMPGQPNWHLFSGYATAQVFVEGLRRAGKELTREGLVNALETIRDFDDGIHAIPVTFTNEDHEGMKGAGILQYNENLDRIFVKSVKYEDVPEIE